MLTSDKARADKFEATVKDFPQLSPKQVSNWFMDDPAAMSADYAGDRGNFADLVEKGTISRNQAKEVLKEVVATGQDPEAIIKEKGLAQISDTGALEAVAQEIINANPKEAADYQGRQDQGHGLLRGPTDEKDQGPGQPAAGQ